jgi:hypothetical protein
MSTGYYASVQSGQQRGLLLGPFEDANLAAAAVTLARLLAVRVDPMAHFHSFGTAKVTNPRLPKGRLNHLIGAAA